MDQHRILITVKTYPSLSRKYGETVCTAGLHEDGSWVRIYPVPFRRLNETEQYKKFDWIECGLQRNPADPRPETCRPVSHSQMQPVGHLDTGHAWRERWRLVLKTAKVYHRLDELIAGAKANQVSLAVFKPTRVLPKLPYSFSYKFEDATGRVSDLQVLDWEAGALYWNCLSAAEGNEADALTKVRQKYFDIFQLTDLHFFLGTTHQFHFVAPNPWVIVGVFPIPYEHQPELLDF
jgi:hypothetical protein